MILSFFIKIPNFKGIDNYSRTKNHAIEMSVKILLIFSNLENFCRLHGANNYPIHGTLNPTV